MAESIYQAMHKQRIQTYLEQTDPCMRHIKNDKGKRCLMKTVYVDDVLVAGESENIKIFKEQTFGNLV